MVKPKRESYVIRKQMLLILKDGPSTPSSLERKLNTNSSTVKKDCKELESYGFIKITKKKHPSNNKTSYEIVLTERGKDVASKI